MGRQRASGSYTAQCTAPAEWGCAVYTCPASLVHHLQSSSQDLGLLADLAVSCAGEPEQGAVFQDSGVVHKDLKQLLLPCVHEQTQLGHFLLRHFAHRRCI